MQWDIEEDQRAYCSVQSFLKNMERAGPSAALSAVKIFSLLELSRILFNLWGNK